MTRSNRPAQTTLATVIMTLAKETKNTVMYQGPAPISQLYVGKDAFPGEYPESITVEVKAG